MPTALNYATQYSQALAQAYPYVLHFAALRSAENDSRYKWTGANTIQIPSLSTTGRVDADRDTITTATRNYNNAWEPKTLSNHRKWVHAGPSPGHRRDQPGSQHPEHHQGV